MCVLAFLNLYFFFQAKFLKLDFVLLQWIHKVKFVLMCYLRSWGEKKKDFCIEKEQHSQPARLKQATEIINIKLRWQGSSQNMAKGRVGEKAKGPFRILYMREVCQSYYYPRKSYQQGENKSAQNMQKEAEKCCYKCLKPSCCLQVCKPASPPPPLQTFCTLINSCLFLVKYQGS